GGSATTFVTDMATAAAFYTEILGLRLQYRAGRIISQ
ncbi:MAG: VOC family protein, partial [Planctomycetes bacterium]|nr:VOC family protein [Planctomycetota bacterium]